MIDVTTKVALNKQSERTLGDKLRMLAEAEPANYTYFTNQIKSYVVKLIQAAYDKGVSNVSDS